MGSLTDFAELELLDHICNAPYTPPATIYLALCTADPTDGATGASMSECADSGSYQRTAITFGAAASRKVEQNAKVTFPEATGAWGTVTHWAVLDTQTHGAGNALSHGALGEEKIIVSGNTPSVASAEIDVTFSANEVSTACVHKLLDLMFRNQAYSSPDTYVALCTATIDDTKTGTTITEPGGGSYARKQVNVNGGATPTWDIAVAGLVDNTHLIALITATAPWGTCVAVAICSAASAGDVLWYDNAMVDQPVGTGDTAQFPIGDLDLTLS